MEQNYPPPVYPKDNGSLERAQSAFREKVKNWNWVDYEDKLYKIRGRKPKKIVVRPEAKARNSREHEAALQKTVSSKFFNF